MTALTLSLPFQRLVPFDAAPHEPPRSMTRMEDRHRTPSKLAHFLSKLVFLRGTAFYEDHRRSIAHAQAVETGASTAHFLRTSLPLVFFAAPQQTLTEGPFYPIGEVNLLLCGRGSLRKHVFQLFDPMSFSGIPAVYLYLCVVPFHQVWHNSLAFGHG